MALKPAVWSSIARKDTSCKQINLKSVKISLIHNKKYTEILLLFFLIFHVFSFPLWNHSFQPYFLLQKDEKFVLLASWSDIYLIDWKLTFITKMQEDEDKFEQPDVFDLELDLVRWVKQSFLQNCPVLMQKPSGNVTQYYGLDSKSRWREAICVMMIYSDPGMSNDGLTQLGQQLANLFKQV